MVTPHTTFRTADELTGWKQPGSKRDYSGVAIILNRFASGGKANSKDSKEVVSMPQGLTPQREREYKELIHDFKEEGRYKGREEEVAARIVNKHRSDYGETQEAREKDRRGDSPDRHLAIRNYEQMNIDEVIRNLRGLTDREVQEVIKYERRHLNRKSLLEYLEEMI